VRQGQGSGAVEHGIHLLQTDIVDGETHQGVLHDGVVQLVLAALGAQSGVLSHSDSLVVHKHAAAGGLELLGQLGHDGLLLAENLCVRHLEFTSVEIESNFSDADATKKLFSHSKQANTAQRISSRCGCILGRISGLRPPAVFEHD